MRILAVVLLSLVFAFVQCRPKGIGEPIFSLEGSLKGNNFKNFQGGLQAGVGTKVWEKGDMNLELGAHYGQNFGRVDGHTFKSKPEYGVDAILRWDTK